LPSLDLVDRVHPSSSFPSPPAYSFDCLLSVPSELIGLSTFTRSVVERLPWGFVPLRDFNRGSNDAGSRAARHHPFPSHPGWDLSSRTFRPWRFARLRRFAPPSILRACFISLPRAGFLLQGFVPRGGSVPGFLRPSPLWSLGALACGFPLQLDRRRLQGFSPRLECGGLRNGLDHACSAPLLVFAFLGLLLFDPGIPLRDASAFDLFRDEPTARGP